MKSFVQFDPPDIRRMEPSVYMEEWTTHVGGFDMWIRRGSWLVVHQNGIKQRVSIYHQDVLLASADWYIHEILRYWMTRCASDPLV
jgi:hypothetical protein